MKRSVGDLANFSDDRLFKEVSEGIPLIVENAVSLDETAHRLYRDKEFRASEIIGGFAKEEAAKVLILTDLVRCPRDWEQRGEIARRFYGHVTKRIYSMSCSYPRIASFRELCALVESESRPYYLDGPNWVDWIFPNSISAEREQTLYVDYVQDITDETGHCYWSAPTVPPFGPRRYESPDCVTLSRALSDAGANSPDGLAVIADIWRGFKPEPETDRGELRGLIAHTLERLKMCGLGAGDESASSLIVSCWSFPLWPLAIKEPRGKLEDLEELREQRAGTVEWIQETEAKRRPPPAISRSKVKALGDAYANWERDVDAGIADRAGGNEGGLRIRSSADIEKDFELPSYARVENMFQELTEEERAALLALGWFAREQVADWPRIYERARFQASTLNDAYQISYGRYWLAGLDRWEEKPRLFKAGQRYCT